MDAKGRIYVALSLGCRSLIEISNRCNLPETNVSKIVWQNVKTKEIRYEKYSGIEIFGNTVHFFLTREGKQEMRIICLENRIELLEQQIKEK
jgi:hypothetical protein